MIFSQLKLETKRFQMTKIWLKLNGVLFKRLRLNQNLLSKLPKLAEIIKTVIYCSFKRLNQSVHLHRLLLLFYNLPICIPSTKYFKGPMLYCFSSISHSYQRSNNTVFEMHSPKSIRGPEFQQSKNRSSELNWEQAVSVPAPLNANELHLSMTTLPATCPSQGEDASYIDYY